jgi:succinate-semialdehyde dehydrogenase/glutarate-semialdehyde dehydrogenase
MILKSINPLNGLLIEEFEEFSAHQINTVIKNSARAYSFWKNVSFKERSALMYKAAGVLIQNKEKYSCTITTEMGKPITESRAEIEKCAWVCEYYASAAEEHLKTEFIKTDAITSRVQFEPIGTILGIMPWNFPFWQAFRFLAPTLMAGNVALLKHASNVQRCALCIEDVFREAGFPESVIAVLIIGSARIKKVIQNETVKAVTLTGSEKAGSQVAAEAGKNIKKTVMELGGSNAFIVLEDADIEKAVETGIAARFQNCGQSCIAAKRFFVHRDVAKAFTSKFIAKARTLISGNPMDERTEIGPLSSISQAIEVERQVNESIEMGAGAELAGYRDQAFFSPAVLTNVKPGMPVFDEEVFGPVAPITIVNDENEAVKLANLSRFGLGTSIFTKDMARAEKLISRFDDGAVFINALVKSDPRLPFGGTKKSGYGRELSDLGIKEFVNAKTVYINE